MLVRCPTCHGKGRVPDATRSGPMMYYNPHTGDNWPHVICQSCGGSGWVDDGTNRKRPRVAPQEDD